MYRDCSLLLRFGGCTELSRPSPSWMVSCLCAPLVHLTSLQDASDAAQRTHRTDIILKQICIFIIFGKLSYINQKSLILYIFNENTIPQLLYLYGKQSFLDRLLHSFLAIYC